MDDHYPSHEDEDDDELVRSLQSHNHHHQHVNSPSFAPNEYQHPSISSIDPSLENSDLPNASANGGGSGGLSGTAHNHSNHPLTQAHFPRQIYTDISRAALYPGADSSPAVSVSPQFPSTPQKQQKQLLPAYTPDDRALPAREVTDENIDDAYVQFIMYCNPTVPLNTDCTELRKAFRLPPKSDGKTFNTYTLLTLIGKFEDKDDKEIRTWTKLAIELGVEPPMMEKQQSTQKVQQYAVRLKRWMHAMHVDAFFEYCLGKPHLYYTQIPPLSNPHPEFGRDGVPAEEDLALRALHPDSRPKRGRRKMEDKENDGDLTPAKRPHLDTNIDGFGDPHSALFPNSAVPTTAHPDDMDRFVDHLDPWTAASAITPGGAAGPSHSSTPQFPSSSGGQHFRWRLFPRDAGTPSTAHPHSAITPTVPDSALSLDDTPQSAISAITPSSAASLLSASRHRSRRRHGPAVSSAWPSSGNPLTGKLRGRPPSNRSVRDGPFSTFPANPKGREGPIIDLSPSAATTPVVGPSPAGAPQAQHFQFPPPPIPPKPTHQPQRPSGLHLQVPQRASAPMVQINPTPTIRVNGTSGAASSSPPLRRVAPGFFDGGAVSEGSDAGRSDVFPRSEDVERAFAGRLLRADLIDGTSSQLSVEEARAIAAKVLKELRRSSQQSGASEDDAVVNLSVWLGVYEDLDGKRAGGGEDGGWPKDLKVTRVTRPSSNGAGNSTGRSVSPANLMRNGAEEDELDRQLTDGIPEKTTYSITWNVGLGPLTGSFAIEVSVVAIDTQSQNRGATPEENAVFGIGRLRSESVGEVDADGEADESIGDLGWRKKFLLLQKRMRDREEEMGRLRRRVLEAVL